MEKLTNFIYEHAGMISLLLFAICTALTCLLSASYRSYRIERTIRESFGKVLSLKSFLFSKEKFYIMFEEIQVLKDKKLSHPENGISVLEKYFDQYKYISAEKLRKQLIEASCLGDFIRTLKAYDLYTPVVFEEHNIVRDEMLEIINEQLVFHNNEALRSNVFRMLNSKEMQIGKYEKDATTSSIYLNVFTELDEFRRYIVACVKNDIYVSWSHSSDIEKIENLLIMLYKKMLLNIDYVIEDEDKVKMICMFLNTDIKSLPLRIQGYGLLVGIIESLEPEIKNWSDNDSAAKESKYFALYKKAISSLKVQTV